MHLMIVGTGYVGLVSGTCLAEMGHSVICHDIDQEKIDRLNKGEIPIYEPQLQAMLEENIENERLFFTQDLAETVAWGPGPRAAQALMNLRNASWSPTCARSRTSLCR